MEKITQRRIIYGIFVTFFLILCFAFLHPIIGITIMFVSCIIDALLWKKYLKYDEMEKITFYKAGFWGFWFLIMSEISLFILSKYHLLSLEISLNLIHIWTLISIALYALLYFYFKKFPGKI